MTILLENYLKIHKISYSEIARHIGCDVSYVQKTVKEVAYSTKNGLKPRQNQKLRQDIADYLRLPYELVWGEPSKQYLIGAISIALSKLAYTSEGRR
ncbi:MAG: hypothetical protein LBJ14_09955 [Desulfarculales bacterium]|jgi:hypothetical protein|nr:hypothetical protein [Desulfarculales bacterium]